MPEPERLSDCFFHTGPCWPRLPISEAAAQGWKIDDPPHTDDFCPDAVAFLKAEEDHAHGWGCDDPWCEGNGPRFLAQLGESIRTVLGDHQVGSATAAVERLTDIIGVHDDLLGTVPKGARR